MSDGTDEPISADELRLLEQLAQALGPDVVPDGLVDRAEQLVTFMDVDQELVALLDEAVETAGARGSVAELRRLAFEAGDGAISIELVLERDDVLTGQVLAGELDGVSLEGLDGTSSSSAIDDLGRFSLRGYPSGPARLRLRAVSGRSLVTDWFLL